MIAKKSDKNQAGTHPEEKWLLVAPHPIWEMPLIASIEGCLAHPSGASGLSDKLDLRCFDEVWVAWESSQPFPAAISAVQATSVIVFGRAGSPPRRSTLLSARSQP